MKKTCLFIMMTTSVLFIQSCNDSFDTDRLNISETVASSIEYENYLVACLTFSNEGTVHGSPQIAGKINGKNVWRQTAVKIDRQLFDNAIETYGILVDKFPEYRQMSNIKKNELLNRVSIKSEKVKQLIPIDKLSPTIRLKQDSETLSIPGFFLQWFESIAAAFQECMSFSQTNNVESGGYIFPDGRALFIIDSLATDTTMNIPVWRNGASATFHYHPYGDTNMSPTDSLATRILQNYSIDSVIIITSDTISGYGF